jgi:hypothetical protein
MERSSSIWREALFQGIENNNGGLPRHSVNFSNSTNKQ